MSVTSNSILFFKLLTKYDIAKYFDECNDFFKTDYQNIANFYNARVDSVETKSVLELKRLIKESDFVNEQFKNNSSKFKTVEFWDLIEFCENLKSKLELCSNLSKFLRSSRTEFNFGKGYSHEYQLSNQQTFEDVSQEILKDNTPDDDWVNIALKNNIREIDWSISGGKNLTLYREKFIQNFVTSVIDNMSGEKIYGLDIKKKIEFFENDFVVLSYKETVFQSVEIMSKVKRGDIPEFSSLGVPSSLYIGSNLASLSYSSVIRDMKKVFSTDDLFINFKINEIKQDQDNFLIDFSIETKFKLLIQTTTFI